MSCCPSEAAVSALLNRNTLAHKATAKQIQVAPDDLMFCLLDKQDYTQSGSQQNELSRSLFAIEKIFINQAGADWKRASIGTKVHLG